MYLAQIEFASPNYDDLVALRKEALIDPLKMTFELEDWAAEAELLHYALFSEEHELLGGVILKPEIETEAGKRNEKAELQQIVIAPEYQGQGLGRFMLSQLERVALFAGWNHLSLLTHTAAKAFYEKLGYKQQGKEKMIQDQAHHLMVKRMKEELLVEAEAPQLEAPTTEETTEEEQ